MANSFLLLKLKSLFCLPIKNRGLVVRIKGGLGNQLFQYIAGKSIAHELGASFYCDFSSYIGYRYHHHNMLNLIGLPNDELDSKNSKKLKELHKLDETSISSYKDLSKINQTEDLILLDGYWQDEVYLNPKYVEEVYAALGKKYQHSDNQILNLVKSSSAIAVHIRRRDYAHMGLCTEEYYIGAISALRLKYPETQVLIFSDEPNYSEYFLRPFLKDNFQVVMTGDDILELYIMTLCEHVIMSNSTFSWWGAFFNEESKKNIICPYDWVMVDKNFKICPQRWVQVKGVVNEVIPSEGSIKSHKDFLASTLHLKS
jgi:hypothetical protein